MARFAQTIVALLFAGTSAAAQDSTVVLGSAVSSVDGAPLSYSTIAVTPGMRRFSKSDGSFSFRAGVSASFRLTVKHLGFLPFDTTIVASGATVQLRVMLTPLAYRLAAVRTEARHPCVVDIRKTELSGILDQVTQNAEREDLLRRIYPFEYKLERTRRSSWSGSVSRWVRDTTAFLSSAVDPYQPGSVVRETSSADEPAREMRIPQLTDLADPVFLDGHCFSYGGIRHEHGTAAYEIDFEPTSDVRVPDVRGSVLLDTATYQIRRAFFSLTRAEDLSPPVAGLEVTTTYKDLFRCVSLFEGITSEQVFYRGRPTDAVQTQSEFQRLLSVVFIGRSPEPMRDSLASTRIRSKDRPDPRR